MKSLAVLALSSSFAFALSAAGVQAQEVGDIGLVVRNGRITTGSYDAFANFTPGRVFGATFGEVLPNFADEPGFDTILGAFNPASSIGFIVHGPVRTYNAVTTTFNAGPAPTVFQIGFGGGVVTPVLTPTTQTDVTGFSLQVAADGTFHEHPEYTLPAGTLDGIYLLELSLFSSSPSVGASEHFFMVFNQNRPVLEQVAALAAAATLVPAPGSLATLLLTGGLAACRRRAAK
ncbi:hypothetical protein BH11PLA1_BH11PLA1_02850 [soil metagenome]